jgi:hypothetical protein
MNARRAPSCFMRFEHVHYASRRGQARLDCTNFVGQEPAHLGDLPWNWTQLAADVLDAPDGKNVARIRNANGPESFHGHCLNAQLFFELTLNCLSRVFTRLDVPSREAPMPAFGEVCGPANCQQPWALLDDRDHAAPHPN